MFAATCTKSHQSLDAIKARLAVLTVEIHHGRIVGARDAVHFLDCESFGKNRSGQSFFEIVFLFARAGADHVHHA